MTSTLHRSPSQAKREARRFEVLKAQRLRLLRALEAVLADAPQQWISFRVAQESHAAVAQVRACQVVPLEEAN